MTLSDYLGLPWKGRHPCPLCEGSRSLSLTDEGRTGLWHCFRCGEGGDGASLYAALEDVSWSEAMTAFGYPPDSDAYSERDRERLRARAKRQARRQRNIERLNAKLIEIERLKLYMTERDRTRWSTLISMMARRGRSFTDTPHRSREVKDTGRLISRMTGRRLHPRTSSPIPDYHDDTKAYIRRQLSDILDRAYQRYLAEESHLR